MKDYKVWRISVKSNKGTGWRWTAGNAAVFYCETIRAAARTDNESWIFWFRKTGSPLVFVEQSFAHGPLMGLCIKKSIARLQKPIFTHIWKYIEGIIVHHFDNLTCKLYVCLMIKHFKDFNMNTDYTVPGSVCSFIKHWNPEIKQSLLVLMSCCRYSHCSKRKWIVGKDP